MKQYDDIIYERKLLGSPAIVWPFLSNSGLWETWFAKTESDLELGKEFALLLTYFPSDNSALWQGKVHQIKNQIMIEFALYNLELSMETQVRFFVKQNNENLLLSIQHSGFTAESFWQGLKVRKERKRLMIFWEKALHKLEYQLELKLKG
ncbi:hypothetical protein PVA45_00805 [Entomospira entomophila]|uniref:SRPBCC domain-containing protein n=1 Tax=Entomospira entomophila TaxID=2719988 RepID=A0A968GBU1_9SPIO|nr:hypothetical protein [Entomospira entomophilus]NIZ40059.1 hypothetical protein [Entomospira entomophilus]WDI35620.1 hypothetical protein PVA45_00805 [Entomospira entomophilus]